MRTSLRRTHGKARFRHGAAAPVWALAGGYSMPSGDRFTAERTFVTRAEAASYLAGVQADLDRGAYVDPVAAAETFGDYATTWLAQRADLRPRTAELYQGLLTRHLLPHLATVPLARITPAMVRRWHAGRLQSRLGPSTVAKSYRLLKTILKEPQS